MSYNSISAFNADGFTIGILNLRNNQLSKLNVTYLLYAKTYPWYLSDKEKTLKEQDIQLLLVRYFSKISDEVITIDYYDPENGG